MRQESSITGILTIIKWRRKTPAFRHGDIRRGSWEVKCNEKNIPAKELWNKITAEYHPKKIHLNETETVLLFSTT